MLARFDPLLDILRQGTKFGTNLLGPEPFILFGNLAQTRRQPSSAPFRDHHDPPHSLSRAVGFG